jgi:choline-sulfatase
VDLPRTSDSDRRRALYHGRHKIIAFGDDAYFQVFDLQADPDEARSLEKDDPTAFADMIERYRAATKAIRDIGPYACRTLKGAPPGRGY